MIRHIALFRFKDHITSEDIDRLDASLRALPDRIDVIRSYTCGRDLELIDETWDYAVVADFDTPDDYHAYSGHPEHVEASATVAKPMMAESTRVQFVIE